MAVASTWHGLKFTVCARHLGGRPAICSPPVTSRPPEDPLKVFQRPLHPGLCVLVKSRFLAKPYFLIRPFDSR